MSGTEEFNPYAPPTAALDSPTDIDAETAGYDLSAIDAAIARLNAHLADPTKVEADRRLEDGWGTPGLLVWGILLAAGLALSLAPAPREWEWLAIAGVVLAIIAGIGALVVGSSSLRVGPRSRAADAAAALKQHLAAMGVGRTGTVIAGLCPTAREQTALPPNLDPVPTASEPQVLGTKTAVKKYLTSFARAGGGQVRWMRIKGKVTVVGHLAGRQDVAVCQATLQFTAWPQWANILSFVLFIVIRIIGIIVGVVLYYTLRKRRKLTFHKTLIRGQDGLWYLYLPAPIERVVS